MHVMVTVLMNLTSTRPLKHSEYTCLPKDMLTLGVEARNVLPQI